MTQRPPPVPHWLRGPWLVSTSIALLAIICLSLAASPLERFDRECADALLRLRFHWGFSPQPDENVFLIGLEKSDLEGLSTIEAEYRVYAEILQKASDLSAAVVAFDLIFARGGAAEAAPIMAAARSGRGAVFAEADTGEREILRSFPFAPAEFPGGLVNISPDSDGVHRRYDYATLSSGICRPSLALAEYLVSRGALQDLKCPGDGSVRWPELAADARTLVEKRIPASAVMLNYRSPFTEPWNRGFKYLNLRDLRRKYNAWKASPGPVPADLPGPGSLMITGLVAPGSGDSGPTPFGKNEPKVEIHAVALNDLIQNQIISGARGWLNSLAILSLVVIFTAAGLYAGSYLSLGALWMAVTAAPLVAGAMALIETKTYYPAVTPAAIVTLCFLAEAGRRAALASLEKLRMRTTMAMYFSPHVLEEVLKNPGAMKPREAELTVLITDLRNFTTITERFGTPVIFDVMNRVFEIETRAVLELDGSMEHFLGDQFLGYWGAPNERPDASERAMRAGSRIITELDELKRSLPPDLAALFGFGLAIHRGKALVGNKGSLERFDYGILGDIVNTAARVESLTKLYGVRWLITREVLETQSAPPPHRFLDSVRVKGRTHSIELIEVSVDASDDWPVIAARYEAARLEYARGRFEEALKGFEELDREYADRPSRVMAQRCRELIAAVPAEWDGAYAMKEK